MTDKNKTTGERPADFLVCGSTPFLNARKARCGQCHVPVWPTAGSLEWALQREIPLICLTCYAKVADSYFGGFIEHGIMLDAETGAKMFEGLQQQLATEAAGSHREAAPPSIKGSNLKH